MHQNIIKYDIQQKIRQQDDYDSLIDLYIEAKTQIRTHMQTLLLRWTFSFQRQMQHIVIKQNGFDLLSFQFLLVKLQL
jgi:hypothetical protein